MPNYLLYRDDVETLADDEQETHQKIIDVMTEGQNITRAKYGRAVRISHAKAHGLLKGELRVLPNLAPELAQGMFAEAKTYPVIVRLAQVPGELLDDSKVSTPRGMAIKVFGVSGPRLAGYDGDTQDWVLDNGKEFITGGAKAFLQAFKPNAEVATKLSDTTKGVVSDISRGTNAVLKAIGMNSDKLDFFGHPKKHPLAEPYFSQAAFRYGDYVAKLGVLPDTPGLKALEDQPFDPETPNALREATVAFFQQQPAEFVIAIQLNTGLDTMPIEDASAPWSEEESQYQPVARLILPVQIAWDPAREGYVEDLSFSPGHSLAAHRPLGSINRARLAAYRALAATRRSENNKPQAEPTSADAMPA